MQLISFYSPSLSAQKMKFSIKDSSVTVTKSAGNCAVSIPDVF